MIDKINVHEKLAAVDDYFQPKIVASMNELKIEVVKIRGPFVWHSHGDTDDLFFVLRGALTLQLEDRDLELRAGDLFVVPRGARHRPVADEEAHVLLIEPRGTPNTGDAGGKLTATEEEI